MTSQWKRILFLIFFILLWSQGIKAQSKLNVHGYLTQTYAFTDGHQLFGIPHSGTSDYRTLALQFRYDINEQNNLIVQFNHERVGLSPLMALQEDVDLDWGYFEHRFNEIFSLKAGKIQMPLGIYNEIRDVGVLIPFYRLPYSPYGEGNYMSETVDGITVNIFFDRWSPWEWEVNLYGGHWQWKEWFQFRNPLTGEVLQQSGMVDVEPAWGVQLRISTPIEGVRIAMGGQMGKASGGVTFSEDGFLGQRNFHNFYGALDIDQTYFYLRSEYLRHYFHNTTLGARVYYVQFGLKILDNLSLNSQADFLTALDSPVPTYLQTMVGSTTTDIEYNANYALGIKYAFSAELVVKVETNWNKGYLIEDVPLVPMIEPPRKTRYTIFSLSASF